MGTTKKIKVKDWLFVSTKVLSSHCEFPNIEARVLLSHVLDKPHEWLVAHSEIELDEQQYHSAEILLERLKNGEPLPYLIGKQYFYGHEFQVTPDVLIPRPETELLVEECIKWLEENPGKRIMADVGTGSGAIAITLALHINDLNVTATDISQKALEVARNNANTLKVSNKITLIQDDLLENCSTCFDIIAANLPYIPSTKLKTLTVSEHEPLLALDGGENGLLLIKKLLQQCKSLVNPGGLIILEIEEGQSKDLCMLVSEIYPSKKFEVLNDLAKRPRVLKIYF